MSFLRDILGWGRSAASAGEPSLPDQTVRRAPPYACAGCKRWATSPLVYLNNQQSYCLDCARKLASGYGYRLVGRRNEDVSSLH